MPSVRLAALVTVMVTEGQAVAPGNTFDVETEEEALRLEAIGAATILDDVAEADLRPNPGEGDGA